MRQCGCRSRCAGDPALRRRPAGGPQPQHPFPHRRFSLSGRRSDDGPLCFRPAQRRASNSLGRNRDAQPAGGRAAHSPGDDRHPRHRLHGGAREPGVYLGPRRRGHCDQCRRSGGVPRREHRNGPRVCGACWCDSGFDAAGSRSSGIQQSQRGSSGRRCCGDRRRRVGGSWRGDRCGCRREHRDGGRGWRGDGRSSVPQRRQLNDYTILNRHPRGDSFRHRTRAPGAGCSAGAPHFPFAAGLRQQSQPAPGLARTTRRAHVETSFGVVLGQQHGGHLIEELGHALLARARGLSGARVCRREGG